MSASEKHYLKRLAAITAFDQAGEIQSAIAEARSTATAAREAGDEGYGHFFEGEVLYLQEDLEGSADAFQAAVKLLPEVSFVHSNYAVLLSLMDKVNHALRHLETALRFDVNNVQAWAQKSICLAKLNRHTEALKCFDQVLRHEPKDLHALRNKAISCARLGRDNEAMALFDQVLAYDPTDRHAASEREILKEEMLLMRTPFGWLLLWLRRRVFPVIASLKFQR